MSDDAQHRDEALPGEYPVSPLPKSYGEATSPAYRPSESAESPETYPVGPEVDDANFAIGAKTWREAAAGVRRLADDMEVAEPPATHRSRGRVPVRRAVERQLAETHDARIATADDPARFTLRGLFLLVTLASVVFAFGSRMPRGMFAGVSGVAAFATLIAAKWLKQGGAVFQAAWWLLLVIYLLASAFAALGL
jgi:hypothetical protein